MLKAIIDILSGTFVHLVGQLREKVIEIAKIEASAFYIRCVMIARRACLLAVLLTFCVLMIALSLVVIPPILVLSSDLDSQTKLTIIGILGGLDILLPTFFIWRFFSQKRWMRFTRSDELLKTVLQQK